MGLTQKEFKMINPQRDRNKNEVIFKNIHKDQKNPVAVAGMFGASFGKKKERNSLSSTEYSAAPSAYAYLENFTSAGGGSFQTTLDKAQMLGARCSRALTL